MEAVSAVKGFVILPGGTIGILLIIFGFLAFREVIHAVVQIRKMRIEQSGGKAPLSSGEADGIQRLFRGFEQLSKRVEALETIPLDCERKG